MTKEKITRTLGDQLGIVKELIGNFADKSVELRTAGKNIDELKDKAGISLDLNNVRALLFDLNELRKELVKGVDEAGLLLYAENKGQRGMDVVIEEIKET